MIEVNKNTLAGALPALGKLICRTSPMTVFKSIKIEEVSVNMTIENPTDIPKETVGGTKLTIPSFTTKLSEPLFPLFAELQFAKGTTVFSRIPLSFNLLMPSTQIKFEPVGNFTA